MLGATFRLRVGSYMAAVFLYKDGLMVSARTLCTPVINHPRSGLSGSITSESHSAKLLLLTQQSRPQDLLPRRCPCCSLVLAVGSSVVAVLVVGSGEAGAYVVASSPPDPFSPSLSVLASPSHPESSTQSLSVPPPPIRLPPTPPTPPSRPLHHSQTPPLPRWK